MTPEEFEEAFVRGMQGIIVFLILLLIVLS